MSDNYMQAENLPRYKCHKVVSAFKIAAALPAPSELTSLVSEDGKHSVLVKNEWYFKLKPGPGWYFVQYEDGYQSVSPAKAFEDGYKLIEP